NTLDGVVVAAGASNVTIGGTQGGAGNVISANHRHGVLVQNAGTNHVVIQGNKIGIIDAAGVAALGNTFDGVVVFQGASNVTIGTIDGFSPTGANVIAGNGRAGVNLAGAGTSNVRVLGNFIGTNASLATLPGNGIGVLIVAGASFNAIGDAGVGNV